MLKNLLRTSVFRKGESQVSTILLQKSMVFQKRHWPPSILHAKSSQTTLQSTPPGAEPKSWKFLMSCNWKLLIFDSPQNSRKWPKIYRSNQKHEVLANSSMFENKSSTLEKTSQETHVFSHENTPSDRNHRFSKEALAAVPHQSQSCPTLIPKLSCTNSNAVTDQVQSSPNACMNPLWSGPQAQSQQIESYR